MGKYKSDAASIKYLLFVLVNNFSDISKKAKKREKQKKRKKQLDMYRHRIYLQLNKQCIPPLYIINNEQGN